MGNSTTSARYEIRVQGVLDPARFTDLDVTSDGTDTVIAGELVDQSALHGLLAQIRDLGLCLVSVCRLDLGERKQRSAEPNVAPNDR